MYFCAVESDWQAANSASLDLKCSNKFEHNKFPVQFYHLWTRESSLKHCSIDTISEASWTRTIIKEVTKMSRTLGTQDLSCWNHLRPVHLPGDVVLALVVVVQLSAQKHKWLHAWLCVMWCCVWCSVVMFWLRLCRGNRQTNGWTDYLPFLQSKITLCVIPQLKRTPPHPPPALGLGLGQFLEKSNWKLATNLLKFQLKLIVHISDEDPLKTHSAPVYW